MTKKDQVDVGWMLALFAFVAGGGSSQKAVEGFRHQSTPCSYTVSHAYAADLSIGGPLDGKNMSGNI